MISIVNYGMGNLGSVVNMFKHIGVASEVVENPEQLRRASKILLPGVGSFDHAMNSINESGFREILDHKALVEKVPLLGICLGMQLLTRSSEEGQLGGLGWIPASTKRIPQLPGMKIPHMGWNEVVSSCPSELTRNLPENPRFYFVHSYYVKVDNSNNSILTCNYGIEFDAAVQCENIFGAQFHPEKSHKYGKKLLENFALL
jgi:glutamine amidotransferase